MMRLSPKQIEKFIDDGYLIVKGCFPAVKAEEWIDSAFAQLSYDRGDPGTWKDQRAALPGSRSVLVSEFAPKAWAAICQLVGGRERIVQPENHSWSDSFIIKFPLGKARPWRAPSRNYGGWHKDGPTDRPHFLDSPEMGLVTYVLWSKLKPRGGGTFLAPESVPYVARYLAKHPEGVDKMEFSGETVIKSCRRFVELTGDPGDVILAHPYLLHAESDNSTGPPRFFTVRMIELAEPMDFSGQARELSPVERAVLRGLGVERFRFQREK